MSSIEKRRFPRVDANIFAQVCREHGEKLDVIVLDISGTGLKLLCNTMEREILTPRGEWTENGRPIEAKINMELPVGTSEVHRICISSLVAYSRRVSMDQFHVGMKYQGLNDEDYKILADFVRFRIAEES